MLEINLLPEELKLEAKKLRIEPKRIIFYIPLVFGAVMVIHIYLAMVGITQNLQYNILNNKWDKLQPGKKTLENFRQEYTVLSQDASIIHQLTNQRINWSVKLNALSLNLPSGIWFNEITLSENGFILNGSVFSLQKEEMYLINKLINSLKNDKVFFKDFEKLELNSVKRKTIGGYEIIDFILTGTLKSI